MSTSNGKNRFFEFSFALFIKTGIYGNGFLILLCMLFYADTTEQAKQLQRIKKSSRNKQMKYLNQEIFVVIQSKFRNSEKIKKKLVQRNTCIFRRILAVN